MAIKINLLPPESTVSGPLGKIIKITRTLNVIFLAGFIIFAVGLGAFFIFSTLQLQNINASMDQVKREISAQEKSEQQLIILKDRLGKIQVVQGLPNSIKNLSGVDPLISALPSESASLTELDLDSKGIDLSVIFRSNSSLTNFVSSLSESQLFRTVVMTSFGYNPATGYLVSLTLI